MPNNPTLATTLKNLDLEFLHGVPVHLTDEMVEQIKAQIEQALEYIIGEDVEVGTVKGTSYKGENYIESKGAKREYQQRLRDEQRDRLKAWLGSKE